jgi:hypothetical protein
VSARLGQIEVLNGAGNTVGWVTRILAPGAVADNGLLKLAPGAPADTHVHYVSEFSSFAAAITALTGAGHQHLIIPTLQTLTAAVDVPTTITLECIGAGGFTSASSFDLTIRGGFISDPTQRFFGSVNVKFVQSDTTPNTLLDCVYAEWWGAQGNDSTNDSTAFNAALAAIKTSRGIALRLLARPYKASITIPAPSNAVYPVTILGSGDGCSIRTASAGSPALSLDLGASDPNTTLIFRDFSLGGRGTMSAPTLSLKAQGGTSNRLFGTINVKVVGSGNLADVVYIRGGLELMLDLRTEEGRYPLYLEGCSNSKLFLHAGNNTLQGPMINGGANNKFLSLRVEDSNLSNTRAVSSISKSGSTVTVVTTTPHGCETMDRVTMSGVTGTNYNFTSPRSITVTNSTTFTYDAVSETGSASGGTVRISGAALRFKDTSFNSVSGFANEGKEGLDYGIWFQSTGNTATGEPSCSYNTIFGGSFAAVANTSRTDLASVLMEGPCVGNKAYGITIGKSSVLNANSWEVLLLGNALGVRPRANKFEGQVYSGTGASLTFRYSEPIVGSYGNRFELYERAVEHLHVFGDSRNITTSTTVDALQVGTFVYTSGAGATVTITLGFAAYAGMKPTTFINNSTQVMRIDPNGTETVGTGGAGKYLEVSAGGSVVLGCTVAGKLDILSGAGTLSFEP